MLKTKESKICKLISFVLAVVILAASVPFGPNRFATGAVSNEAFCIQIVEKGAVAEKEVECSFYNTDSKLSGSGKTASNGIWETEYIIGSSYNGDNDFTFVVDGKEVKITKDMTSAEKYLIFDLYDSSVSWSDSAEDDVKLVSLATLSAITGVANGTQASSASLGLPQTVKITTEPAREMKASVEWDINGSGYRPEIKTAQTVDIKGTVTLPAGVINPENVSLKTTVKVSVNAANDAVFTTQPVSFEAKAGDTAELSVQAADADESTYQWYKDGKELSGKNNKVLSFDKITVGDSGEYYCAVTGVNGNKIKSSSAVVTVTKNSTAVSLSTNLQSPQTRPVKSGIVLTAGGLPADATGSFAFFINGVEKSSGATNHYTFFPESADNEYTFKVKYSGDGKYESSEDEIRFSLNKSEQETPRFIDNNYFGKTFRYGEVTNFTVCAEGGNSKYIYAIADEKDADGKQATGIAEIVDSSTGAVRIKKAGSFVVTVKCASDNDYNESTVAKSKTVTVLRSDQAALKFEKEGVFSVTYNENGNEFINTVSGGSTGKKYVYSSSDIQIAEVDANGKVVIKKSGSVKITAVCPGNENYNEVSAEYTLKIEKADQTIKFETENPEVLYFGNSFINPAFEVENPAAADGKGYSDKDSCKIKYSVLREDVAGTATVDTDSGKLTVYPEKEGKVTIKAEKPGNECYNAAYAEYTAEVKLYTANISIKGDKKDSSSGWYTDTVSVIPQDGHLISTDAESTEWSESIVITKEGAENGITVYLKQNKEFGAITPPIVIKDGELQIDKTKPSDLKIEYKNVKWYHPIGETLTFGLFKGNISFTLFATDNISGVDSFHWEYKAQSGFETSVADSLSGDSNPDEIKRNSDGTASATFSLPINDIDQIRGYISFVAKDSAGNSESFVDERIIVIDTVAPTVSVEYSGDFAGYVTDDDNNAPVENDGENVAYVYKSDAITAKVKIDELNFWPEDYKIILDGVEVENISWLEDNGIHYASFLINEQGKHRITVKYTDKLSKEETEYTLKPVIIDSISPIISKAEILGIREDENSRIFRGDKVTLTVSIKESNFRPEAVILSVDLRDITGNSLALSRDYEEDLRNAQWEYVNGEHKATIELCEDGYYDIKINYSDISGLSADEFSVDAFSKDNCAPNGIKISYNPDSLKNRFYDAVSKITFNYFNPDVELIISAEDSVSGVDYIEWEYAASQNASDINEKALSGRITSDSLEREDNTNIFTGKIRLDKSVIEGELNGSSNDEDGYVQLDGYFYAQASDVAGNVSEKYSDSSNRVVADTIDPDRTVSYGTPRITIDGIDAESFEETDENVSLYYSEPAEITFTIRDANFYPQDINADDSAGLNNMNCVLEVSENGGSAQKATINEWAEKGNDTYEGKLVFDKPGVYVVSMNYNDRSGNAMPQYVSPEIIVDNTDPVITVSDSRDFEKVNGIYTEKRTVNVQIVEDNFRASDVKLASYNAKDLDGVSVSGKNADYSALLSDESSWTSEGNVHTAQIVFEEEAIYGFALSFTDLSGRSASCIEPEFIVDLNEPSSDDISISYKIPFYKRVVNMITLNYYNPDVSLTVSAVDKVSGIEKIDWIYKVADGKSSINEKEISGTINSENLTASGSLFTGEVTVPMDSAKGIQMDGFFSASATDKAGRVSETSADTTNEIIVDTISPTRTVEISHEGIFNADTLEPVSEYSEGDNVLLVSRDSAEVTFKINEANFNPDDINSSINDEVTEKCSITVQKDGKSESVEGIDWNLNGEVWEGSINFAEEGDYVVSMSYTDRSGNTMTPYTSPVIVIDRTAPQINISLIPNERYYSGNIKAVISVSERYFRAGSETAKFNILKAVDVCGDPVAQTHDFTEKVCNPEEWKKTDGGYELTLDFSYDANYSFDFACTDIAENNSDIVKSKDFTVDKTAPEKPSLSVSYSSPVYWTVINAITFNYYNPVVTVTVSGDDNISGIEKFICSYSREMQSSTSNVSSETVVLDNLSYSSRGRTASGSFNLPQGATEEQYRGNISFTAIDRAGNTSDYVDEDTVIVVDTISPTREVEFSPAKQIVTAEGLKTVDDYDYSTEGVNYKLIYDAGATATVRVTEANFYPEDMDIRVNGSPVYLEDWQENGGDVWENKLSFSDDGHYVVTIEYTDRSTNRMVEYISNEVIVDTVNPKIEVSYSPDNKIATEEGRAYYDKPQTATITITEHNFRASDVEVDISAKDISGSDINIENFAEYLKKDSSWTTNGDVHTARINYANDANYEFNISYTDLALRKADNYQTDLFTVDTTAPENLKVSYSSGVLNTVIESITFAFYNSPVKVKISADDLISGVSQFKYSYVNAKGVSSANAELTNAVVESAKIQYSGSGKSANAEFTIPKAALIASNQFNGTVKFLAVDKTGNKSDELKDNKRIVVDNIAPNIKVSFNSPITVNGGISYYSGNITATVQITEANFYAEDVTIKINGKNANPSKWSHSGDNHSATVVISADGDYKLSVSYKDRSGNAMKAYESGQLTVDRQKPAVTISGIKNESANKGEKIGFVINVQDTNLNASEFKPVLTAVVMTENGSFETKDIAITKVVESGKSCRCVVENLKEDAIYTLKCTAADMAGNISNTLISTDSGSSQLEQLRFSVNRHGSTFMLNEYTREAADSYYLSSVDNDIVIEEINADSLEDYKVELNKKLLVDGMEYTVKKEGGNGRWHKYTYSVRRELFDKEGDYSVVVTSTDKAGSKAYSDLKSASVKFSVDKTAPTVTVSGIEKDGRYRTDKQVVTMVINDDGGELQKLKVVIKDEDGNVISTPYMLEGENLINAIENSNNRLTFEIGEGVYQSVEIICVDSAGNEYVSADNFSKVTVSPNGLVIFWANPVARFGVIGGSVIIAAAFVLVVLLKRKKKKQ